MIILVPLLAWPPVAVVEQNQEIIAELASRLSGQFR
jgi:hypothetical protein